MIIAHILIGISVIPTYLLVTRISHDILGFNDVVFSVFSNAALEVLFVAFVFMPTLVVQIKIVPKNVEATIYNIFSTFKNMAHDFISPMIGGVIANEFGVSSYNFDNIKWIILIQFFVSFVPILFVWILPSNSDIEEFVQHVNKEEQEKEREKKILLQNSNNTRSEFTGSNP